MPNGLHFSADLIRKSLLALLFPFFFHCSLLSQNIIKGNVTDRNGMALSGASVSVKYTKTATLTDTAGNFTIRAAPGNTIEFTYVGYKAFQIILQEEKSLQIILTESVSNLDSVVVIGYGTSTKRDLTGAIGAVSEINFNKGIYSSPDNLIQGKVSGVEIINNSGAPGGAVTVRIRGNSAIYGSGQPLYVIDGIILDGRSLQEDLNPLNFLNPSDIQSIDVLKDASATAIYGSRAAYGVIIITTKKGQTGSPRLDLTASIGVSSVSNKVPVLNPDEYRQALTYYGVDNSFDRGSNVDGQGSIFQNALQQNYNIAVSGGSEDARYRFSAGYLDQQGVVINSEFKKYSSDITSGFRFLPNKKLHLDFNLNASQYLQDQSNYFQGNYPLMGDALSWNPTTPLKNKDGSLIINPAWGPSPLAIDNYGKQNLNVSTIMGSIAPSYKFTDWLEYKLLFSLNYSTGVGRSSLNEVLGAFSFFPQGGNATIKNNQLITGLITQTLSFDKNIAPSLHLSALAGYEYTKYTSQGYSLTGSGSQNAGFGNYGIDYTNYIQYSSVDNRVISSYLDPLYELQSFFGRTIFNYKETYLLTATFRADGSTKFGSNNKYGYFPSFAVAWIISKEKFFRADFVNLLKLRAGWGKTGNQEFPPGAAQALYAFHDNGTLVQLNNPNPNLKWQSDVQFDIGLDFSLFNNRLSGTFDYFNKNTTNLLYPSAPIQPSPPGSTVTWINLDGNIVNKGVELQLTGTIVKSKNLTWSISGNCTFLQNMVSGLPAPVGVGFLAGPIQTIRNGLPMDAFFTRKFTGFDKNGYSVYLDSGNTFYNVGNPNPRFLLGISTTVQYRKFSLIANMYGSYGQDIYNQSLSNLGVQNIASASNIAVSVYKNPVKESFGNPVTPSSRYIQNGDYFKMGNLTISYAINNPGKTIKGMNIYVTAQNLFIITNYDGFSPEVNTDNANQIGIRALGIDFNRYPPSRTFLLGVNFSL